MKIPRQLTARGKAKSGHGGGQRSVHVVDRRGFVHVVGVMATAPQNEASGADLAPRWESYDYRRRIWVQADWGMQRMAERMVPARLESFLRANAGVFRRRPPVDAASIDVDGEAVVLPGGYAPQPVDKLRKALACGLLSIGGRTYRLKLARPGVYDVTGAAGCVRYDEDALLQCIVDNGL